MVRVRLPGCTTSTRPGCGSPRSALLLPVQPWARAYGLIREPAGQPQTISLIGPGPGFDPGYALTTDLDDPVIIAITGKPARPLLIDGCHRLYKAAQLGREHLPFLVLAPTELAVCIEAGSGASTSPQGWATVTIASSDNKPGYMAPTVLCV